MSFDIYVFTQRFRIPGISEWQQALNDSNFEVTLSRDWDCQKDSGWMPGTYKGLPAGFEFSLEPLTDVVDTYPAAIPRIGDRDLAAVFRWGGNLHDAAVGMLASAVLAKIANGVLFDPQAGEFFNGVEAVEMAIKTIAFLDQYPDS